jgi:hypothetical protein
MLRSSYDVGNRQLPIEALWFDDGARSVTRALAKQVRARRVRSILSDRRTFRFVVHPRDVDDPRTRHEISELLAELQAEGWRPAGLPAVAAA